MKTTAFTKYSHAYKKMKRGKRTEANKF